MSRASGARSTRTKLPFTDITTITGGSGGIPNGLHVSLPRGRRYLAEPRPR